MHWQDKQPSGVIAGLSALARYTMLAAPRNDVLAVSPKVWKSVPQRTADAKVAADDPDAIEVEVWSEPDEVG